MQCLACKGLMKSANRDGVCTKCRLAECADPHCTRRTRKRPGETPYCKYHGYQRRQKLMISRFAEGL